MVLEINTGRCYSLPAMSIAQKIRTRREQLGLSQDDLAVAVGTRQQTIAKIELGIIKHSRYLPKIALRLEIPFHRLIEDAVSNTEHNTVESLVGQRDLPVYASAEGGKGALVISTDPVDYVRRPAPLAHVKDGYGLIIVGESMAPEFRPGDTALIHPHLPPARDEACVFYSEDGAGQVRITIKSFVRSTALVWRVRQWNPPKEFDLARAEWQKCHRIIGRYSRR